jgi:hypothetical protein
MSDDMPELIDVAEEAISESQPIEKPENEFKLVVSKRKRRQSKAEAIEADDDDDYEIEQDDEPDNLKMTTEFQSEASDMKIKFHFPPLSGDKLKVNFKFIIILIKS